jgi:hypothetical protein
MLAFEPVETIAAGDRVAAIARSRWRSRHSGKPVVQAMGIVDVCRLVFL